MLGVGHRLKPETKIQQKFAVFWNQNGLELIFIVIVYHKTVPWYFFADFSKHICAMNCFRLHLGFFYWIIAELLYCAC